MQGYFHTALNSDGISSKNKNNCCRKRKWFGSYYRGYKCGKYRAQEFS